MAAPNLTFAELMAMLNRLGIPTIASEFANAKAYTSLDHITSGKYTPIASATQAGVTVTPGVFRWLRIGDEVMLTGQISITTTTDAFTSCKFTTPFDATLGEGGTGVAALASTRAPANVATALAAALDTAALVALAATNSDIDAGTGPFLYHVMFAFTAA